MTLSSVYNLQSILSFFNMLQTARYYYKGTCGLKHLAFVRLIVVLIFKLTAIEKPCRAIVDKTFHSVLE